MKLTVHTGYTNHLKNVDQFPDHIHPQLQRDYFIELCNNYDVVEFKSNSLWIQVFLTLSIQARVVKVVDPVKYVNKDIEWEIRQYKGLDNKTYELLENPLGIPADNSLLNMTTRELNLEFDELLSKEE